MTIYECSVDGCTNFTIENKGLGCAEHGLTLEPVEDKRSKNEDEQ